MNQKIVHYKCLSLVVACLLFAGFAMTGCGDPLDVENPNSLVEGDLEDPTAAASVANGALVTVSRAAGEMLAIYTTATDEGTWTGSRDAWNQLNRGDIGDPNNEFTDDAWQFVTEARFMGDFAIDKLSALDANGELGNREDLARSYLYAALIRVMIADMWDDFVFSNREEAAPPVGEDQMFSLYEQAVDLTTQGLAVTTNAENRARLTALRARAKNGRAIWDMVNPRGTQPPAEPYVDAGRDDAEAVLGMVSPEWRWQLTFSANSVDNDYAFQVNSRIELGIVGDPTLEGKPELYIPVNDPIDGVEDPRVLNLVAEFRNDVANGGPDFSPITVVGEREMQLIVAESDIARGNLAAAKGTLDALRARDGLSAVPAGQEKAVLQHERRANLYLMGRRLADMYRFGVKSPDWQANLEAFNKPGSFFPIVRREIESNPFVEFTSR